MRFFSIIVGILSTCYLTLGSQSYASQIAPASCFDDTLAKLKIEKTMQTDPQLLQGILKDIMFLDKVAVLHERLTPYLEKPILLEPLFTRIQQSIMNKHPAIMQFLCEANTKNLWPTEVNHKLVVQTINHTFLLEQIVQELIADWQLMIAVGDRFRQVRKDFSIREGFFGSTLDILKLGLGIFEIAKTKTIDSTYSHYEAMRKKGFITPKDIHTRQRGLTLNIMEAMMTDLFHGYIPNARAGRALGYNEAESVTMKPENRAIEYVVSQEWSSLYQTWNLAFITAHLSNLHILYPKLLIPQVLDADHKDYVFNRALTLWLTINFALFHKLSGKDDIKLPGRKQLATPWGKINERYAHNFLKHLPERNWLSKLLFFHLGNHADL